MQTNGDTYYIVGFDLNGEGTMDYGPLFRALETFSVSVPLIPSVRLVRTGLSREQVAVTLLNRMGENDRLMLAECSPQALWMFGTSELNTPGHLIDIT